MTSPLHAYLHPLIDTGLDEQVAHISPALLLAYLAGRDWRLVQEIAGGAGQVWGRYDGETLTASVMVPLDNTYADHKKRLHEAVATLMNIESWPISVSLTLPAELRKAAGDE